MIFRASSERGVDPHVMDFLSALSLAFADSEIDLLVHIAPDSQQMEHHERIASRGQVDGMILSAPEPDDPRIELLARRNIPFVVHGRGTDAPDYAYYDIDNEGAFTAATRSEPRSRLTTSVASASLSTSSATTSNGLPARATCSSSGSRSFMLEIFLSWMRM